MLAGERMEDGERVEKGGGGGRAGEGGGRGGRSRAKREKGGRDERPADGKGQCVQP